MEGGYGYLLGIRIGRIRYAGYQLGIWWVPGAGMLGIYWVCWIWKVFDGYLVGIWWVFGRYFMVCGIIASKLLQIGQNWRDTVLVAHLWLNEPHIFKSQNLYYKVAHFFLYFEPHFEPHILQIPFLPCY